jgi:hypothetical protein
MGLMPDEHATQELMVTGRRAATDPPGVADVVSEAVRVGFGAVSLGLAVALRAIEETSPARGTSPARLPVSDVADLLVGTAWTVARASGRLGATGARVATPVVSIVVRPPGVPHRLQPAHGVSLIVARWRRDRPDTIRSLRHWSSTALPGAVEAVLSQLDTQRLATAVLDGIDLDPLVAEVVRRLDVEAVAASVIEGLDVDHVVTAALDQLDLTQLVLDRVDLGRVVAEALQRVDLTEVVMEQVDLIGVAEYVVAGIDLPEIIRASTGSVASEAVRGLRMQGVDADLAVARVVDRMLFRRGHRRTVPTEEPQEVPVAGEAAAQESDLGIPSSRQP